MKPLLSHQLGRFASPTRLDLRARSVLQTTVFAPVPAVTVMQMQAARTDQVEPSLSQGPERAPSNRGRRFPVEILRRDEVLLLVRGCSATAPTGIRNRALIAVLYRGGLRISEALALKAKDIDQTAGTLTVMHGKGDQRRVVGMDPEGFSLLERWLDKRRASLRTGPQSPVFCTLTGRPLRDNYVRTLLARLARKAGIEKRVHPHGLRHTHAAELAAEGVPVTVIQQQLGHHALSMTERYLRHIAPQERIKAMQARQWTVS